jgi:NAD(P)-dependent dehydrogenase (short-subunit alcohol dehydrogenase family)
VSDVSSSRPSGAFVTGGARGIGQAICRVLARRGDTVFLADLDGEVAAASAAAIVAEGHDVRSLQLDVADVDAMAAAVATVDAEVPLSTFVNNAGIGFSEPLLSVTPAQFDRLMAVNLRAVFFGLQAAAKAMTPRGTGSIVNLASTSGFTASTTPMVPYDTSKGAVRMLTVSASRELARTGIRVNAVAPGSIDTDLTRSLATDTDALDRMASKRIPLGHLGEPTDIADAVAWLTSEQARYVTGHTLFVDGGWLT